MQNAFNLALEKLGALMDLQVSATPASYCRSLWYDFGQLEAYIRVRMSNDKLVIANVHLFNPEHEGQGHFKNMMLALEQLCREKAIFEIEFENVISQRLSSILMRQGYADVGKEGYLNMTKSLDAILLGEDDGNQTTQH